MKTENNEKKREISLQLKKIAREARLANENKFGRARSKMWDNRLSTRQDRRKLKTQLRKIINTKSYDECEDL